MIHFPDSAHPLHIHWQLLKSCNYDCAACCENQRDDNLVLLRERLLDMAPAIMARPHPAFIFSLRGGEPTLHPFLADLFDCIWKSGKQAFISLATNGSQELGTYLSLIEQAPPGAFQLALAIHPGPASFNNLFYLIAAIHEKGHAVHVRYFHDDCAPEKSQQGLQGLAKLAEVIPFSLELQNMPGRQPAQLAQFQAVSRELEQRINANPAIRRFPGIAPDSETRHLFIWPDGRFSTAKDEKELSPAPLWQLGPGIRLLELDRSLAETVIAPPDNASGIAISFIVACSQEDADLKASLDSILAQCENPYEIIVAYPSGLPLAQQELLSTYAKLFPDRIKPVTGDTDDSASNAFSLGLKLAFGCKACFLEAGEILAGSINGAPPGDYPASFAIQAGASPDGPSDGQCVAWRKLWDRQEALRENPLEARDFMAAAEAQSQPGQSPLLSVILVTRNDEDTIWAALDILCRELPPNCEILIMDRGSEDSTMRIARAFEDREPRIKIIENAGSREKALLQGHELARGRFAVFAEPGRFLQPALMLAGMARLNNLPEAGFAQFIEKLPEAETPSRQTGVIARAAALGAWCDGLYQLDALEKKVFRKSEFTDQPASSHGLMLRYLLASEKILLAESGDLANPDRGHRTEPMPARIAAFINAARETAQIWRNSPDSPGDDANLKKQLLRMFHSIRDDLLAYVRLGFHRGFPALSKAEAATLCAIPLLTEAVLEDFCRLEEALIPAATPASQANSAGPAGPGDLILCRPGQIEQPPLSLIIVPGDDDAAFAERIHSLASEPAELVIIANWPGQQLLAACSRLAQQFQSISLYRTTRRLSYSDCINLVVPHAQGRYALILDSESDFAPEAISWLAAAADAQAPEIIITGAPGDGQPETLPKNSLEEIFAAGIGPESLQAAYSSALIAREGIRFGAGELGYLKFFSDALAASDQRIFAPQLRAGGPGSGAESGAGYESALENIASAFRMINRVAPGETGAAMRQHLAQQIFASNAKWLLAACLNCAKHDSGQTDAVAELANPEFLSAMLRAFAESAAQENPWQ